VPGCDWLRVAENPVHPLLNSIAWQIDRGHLDDDVTTATSLSATASWLT
jgi:hypothetical protein